MRAVMLEVPESLLLERRRLGLDRWDEVWEGELHMVPPPHGRHGRINDKLGRFFQEHWEDLGLGRTYLETGVRRPDAAPRRVAGEEVPADYRTPDRSFLFPERYDRFQSGWIVGGPDVALEIVSPGDESRAKLPFYFQVGVRAVVLIDRDSYETEVLRAGRAGFESVLPDAERWVSCDLLRTQVRRELDADGRPLLRLRRSDEPGRELAIGD